MPDYTEQSKYPVPCVDVLVFNEKNELLIIQRNKEPHNGEWSIIGGRVEVSDDNIEYTALREVKEETGFDVELEHLVGILAQPDRVPAADPRFFIVQTVYTARYLEGDFVLNHEVKNHAWVSLEEARKKKLAYNHNDILDLYVERKKKLIPVKRTKHEEYYGKEYIYNETNSRVRFAGNAIVLNEKNEILLALRGQKPYVDFWDFPGGHMYVDESVNDCITREVREELGVPCEVGELFHVYSDKGKSPRAADVVSFYFVKILDNHFERNVEMRDFVYFPLDKLPKEIAYHNEGPLEDIRKFLMK